MVSFTSIITAVLVSLAIATPFAGHSVQGAEMNHAVARSFEHTPSLQRMIRSKRVGESQMDKRALNLNLPNLLPGLISCPPGTTRASNSVGVVSCLSLSTPTNCGRIGNQCSATGYTGTGVGICQNGKCGLACPPGSRPQTTASGMAFCG